MSKIFDNEEDVKFEEPKLSIECRFNPMSVNELFAPLEPVIYLVSGLIQASSVCMLAGYGGLFKSWLATALCMAMARGEPWLGRYFTKTGTACYLDYESGSNELRRRFQLIDGAGHHGELPSGLTADPYPEVNMNSDDFAAQIGLLAKSNDLIVIDSFRAANPGSDENDSKISDSLYRLRPVADQTGCTFWVIHHAKKRGKRGGPRHEAVRGSSSIYNAFDTVMVLEKGEDNEVVLHFEKTRNQKSPAPIRVTVSDVTGGVAITAVQDEAAEPDEEAKAEDNGADLKQRVIDYVAANPGCTKGAIQDGLGISRRVVSRVVTELIGKEAIVDRGKKNRAAYFSTHDGCHERACEEAADHTATTNDTSPEQGGQDDNYPTRIRRPSLPSGATLQ